MAERRPTYVPPPLDHEVVIRNPDDPNRPVPKQDEFGNLVQAPWGVPVWAGRTDRAPYTVMEEGVPVHLGLTVWTIRERPGVAANVEVVYGGRVWYSVGDPVERGGARAGRREKYLEIYTRSRS